MELSSTISDGMWPNDCGMCRAGRYDTTKEDSDPSITAV